MKCKAILWDVGGTLVTHGVPIPISVRRRFDDCNLDHHTISDEHIETTLRDYLQDEREWRTIEDEHRARLIWAERMFDGRTLTDEEREAAARALAMYYDVHAPVPGIVELIEEIDDLGITQAIVSNWPPSLPQFLAHHGLDRPFERICFSAQDGIHKPDERIFLRAMNALGAQAQETVMIGDNFEWDIAPTRAMGMRAIHFDPRRFRESCEVADVPTLRARLRELLA